MSEVTAIYRPPSVQNIVLNANTAPLLLELLSKAAAAGTHARFLADLYEQVSEAAKALSSEA